MKALIISADNFEDSELLVPYYRLKEAGARSVELRASELAMVLDGIDVSRLKRVARYERGAAVSLHT